MMLPRAVGRRAGASGAIAPACHELYVRVRVCEVSACVCDAKGKGRMDICMRRETDVCLCLPRQGLPQLKRVGCCILRLLWQADRHNYGDKQGRMYASSAYWQPPVIHPPPPPCPAPPIMALPALPGIRLMGVLTLNSIATP